MSRVGSKDELRPCVDSSIEKFFCILYFKDKKESLPGYNKRDSSLLGVTRCNDGEAEDRSLHRLPGGGVKKKKNERETFGNWREGEEIKYLRILNSNRVLSFVVFMLYIRWKVEILRGFR